jgi:hypothetical protein
LHRTLDLVFPNPDALAGPCMLALRLVLECEAKLD